MIEKNTHKQIDLHTSSIGLVSDISTVSKWKLGVSVMIWLFYVFVGLLFSIIAPIILYLENRPIFALLALLLGLCLIWFGLGTLVQSIANISTANKFYLRINDQGISIYLPQFNRKSIFLFRPKFVQRDLNWEEIKNWRQYQLYGRYDYTFPTHILFSTTENEEIFISLNVFKKPPKEIVETLKETKLNTIPHRFY